MKHIFKLIFIYILLLGPLLSQAQNIITNGSFESGLTGWNNLNGDGAVASFSVETTDIFQGAQAFRVDVTTLGPNAYSTQSINTYTPTVGSDYTITLYAKSLTAGALLRVVSQQPYSARDYTLTTTWTRYSFAYTPSNPSMELAFNFRSLGTYLIDSVTIIKKIVPPPTTETDSLKVLAAKCGLNFGTAVREGSFQTEPYYRSTLLQHFNMVTPENAMKMDAIKPTENGAYDFSRGDSLVKFALANKMKVRGHALLWHSQVPSWVTSKTWTDAELFAYLKTYVTTVVGHYKGKITEWDVVNEAFEDAAGNAFRQSYFLRLGVPVYDSVFTWAHAADPDALLFYNDYETEQMNTKSQKVYDLVTGLIARKAPINGVGLQTHKFYDAGTSFFTELDQNIKRLGLLGLKVAITELDLRIPVPPVASQYPTQAHAYAEILKVALKNPTIVKTFVVWGFTDKYSWIPQTFPEYGYALPFDTIYNAKPAFDSLVVAFKGSCGITAVSNVRNQTAVAAYPNPFINTTVVKYDGQFYYSVYDVRGILVAQGKATDVANIGEGLRNGLYTIKLNGQSEMKTIKVIKSDE